MSEEVKEPEKTIDVHETSFSFSLTRIYKYVMFCAIFAFASCIILSLIYDFEKSTSTHCRVRNYLPSVSAAIGGFIPQKFIWQYLMAIHCSPRIFFSFLAKKYFMSFPTSSQSYSRYVLVHVMLVVEVIEVLSLLLLTIVSSTDIYELHERSFITFVVSAQVNMLLKIATFVSLSNDPHFSSNMACSLRAKVKLWFVNLSAIMLAAYFFYRHNTYCESGVYSLFALCEYSVVVSNILFHATGFLEFANSGATFYIGSYRKNKERTHKNKNTTTSHSFSFNNKHSCYNINNENNNNNNNNKNNNNNYKNNNNKNVNCHFVYDDINNNGDNDNNCGEDKGVNFDNNNDDNGVNGNDKGQNCDMINNLAI